MIFEKNEGAETCNYNITKRFLTAIFSSCLPLSKFNAVEYFAKYIIHQRDAIFTIISVFKSNYVWSCYDFLDD